MRWFIPIFLIALLSGCLGRVPYRPEQLERFASEPNSLRLEFTTDKGRQVAFYLPPLAAPERPPSRLAILFPGISAVALGWLPFIDRAVDDRRAWLLIDYPGRGFCEGMMRPETNYLNVEGALESLAGHFGRKQLDAELDLMGHSFGTGMALDFATRLQVRRIVLVAPFNTLKQATAQISRLLALVLPAQIDNRALIQDLLEGPSPPQITILHGRQDMSLPVEMGRELAALDARITYCEFPPDDHVTILHRRWSGIVSSLEGRSCH